MRLPGAVLVLALALAGCTPAAVVVEPTAVPTSTPSASPTATPSATPTPAPTRPALAELVLSTGGFEQLPLGTDPTTIDPAIAVVAPHPLECDPTIIAWHPADEYGIDANGHPPFYVGVSDGVVRAIQVVWAETIASPEGIGIGSTRQELVAAYPGLDVALSDQRGDVYIVQDDRGWMRFSVFFETETVSEMLATTNDVAFHAPSYHPIGASCL